MTCIFSYTIWSYLKYSLELLYKAVPSGIISQNYTPHMSLLMKNSVCFDVALLRPPGINCPPFPQIFVGNPGDGSPTQKSQIYSFLTPEKTSSKNLRPPASKVSFFTSSNSIFHVITLNKLHLWLQSFLLYHFFNFSLYVHTCHLQHDQRIEWSHFPPSKTSIPLTFQCSFENLASLNACFFHSYFYFKI